METSTTSNRLKLARMCARLSQTKLAELADIDRTSLCSYERRSAGRSLPNMRTALRIAQVLRDHGVNTSVEELFGDAKAIMPAE